MAAVALTPFSETKFDHPAQLGLPVSSPTVDLSVTWDSGAGNVLVCRPRDEVVSRIHQGARRGDAPGVTAVRWKPDGRPPFHPQFLCYKRSMRGISCSRYYRPVHSRRLDRRLRPPHGPREQQGGAQHQGSGARSAGDDNPRRVG